MSEPLTLEQRLWSYVFCVAVVGGAGWWAWSNLPTEADKRGRAEAERQYDVGRAAENLAECQRDLKVVIATRKERFEEYNAQRSKLRGDVSIDIPINPGEWTFLDEDEKQSECELQAKYLKDLQGGMDRDQAISRMSEASLKQTLAALKARGISTPQVKD